MERLSSTLPKQRGLSPPSPQGRGFKDNRENEDFRGTFDTVDGPSFGPAKVGVAAQVMPSPRVRCWGSPRPAASPTPRSPWRDGL